MIRTSSTRGTRLWTNTTLVEPDPIHLHKLTREQKYHSIAKSGKRLEDVLTEDELKELRE
jgi:hypothetical protein